jgi:flagellar basal-body rod modification protein FlgD
MDVNTYKANVLGQHGQQNTTGADAFQELEMGDFLKLMIAELSNQDPMNPMDNSEMLQQLSQMSAIASNDKLTETLGSVQLGQNMATASSLLGQVIRGLDDTGGRAAGTVERVSIAEEEGIRVHVGAHSIKLKNIAEVLPADTDPDTVEWPSAEDDTGEENSMEDLYW